MSNLQIINREIEKIAENEEWGRMLPAPMKDQSVGDLIQARVGYICEIAKSTHILNKEDQEGLDKALAIKKVLVKIRTRSEDERKKAKKRVDEIFAQVFGPASLQESELDGRIKAIEKEREQEIELQRQREEALWTKRFDALTKLGMAYNSDLEQFEVEGVVISRLMAITLSAEDLKGYLIKHVVPVINRIKQEEQLQKQKEDEEKAALRAEQESKWAERLAELEQIGFAANYEEGVKTPVSVTNHVLSITLSMESVLEKSDTEFMLTKQGVLALHKKLKEEEDKSPFGEQGDPIVSIPKEAIEMSESKTPIIHKGLEGVEVDHRKEVIIIQYLVNKARELSAKAKTLESELGKHAAIEYVKRLDYAADYMASTLKDLTNAITKQ